MTEQELKECIAEVEHSDIPEPAKEKIMNVLRAHGRDNAWIPCSERLPEYDSEAEYYTPVNVTLDNGRVAEGCYRNLEGQWWVDAEDGEHYSINATGHVVAWQPLPEPYCPDCEVENE